MFFNFMTFCSTNLGSQNKIMNCGTPTSHDRTPQGVVYVVIWRAFLEYLYYEYLELDIVGSVGQVNNNKNGKNPFYVGGN